MGQMTSQDTSESLATHGGNLWSAIRKVEKLDKSLAEELSNEYCGLLAAMSDILEKMRKHLEH